MKKLFIGFGVLLAATALAVPKFFNVATPLMACTVMNDDQTRVSFGAGYGFGSFFCLDTSGQTAGAMLQDNGDARFYLHGNALTGEWSVCEQANPTQCVHYHCNGGMNCVVE